MQERIAARDVPGILARVYWILAAIFVLITLAAPRLRPFGVVGVVILAVMLGWGVLQRLRGAPPESLPERGKPTSPGFALTAAPLDQVSAENLQLTGGGAPYELRGVIVNRTQSIQLRSVAIAVTRRDCYEGALDPSGCMVVWQEQHWQPISVPPQEQREFSSAIWMRGAAPRPRGEIRDTFELVAATGTQLKPGNTTR